MHTLKPRLSEKAFALSQVFNTFAIDVPKGINKHQIAEAVAKQFDVEVKSIRIVNRPGKSKRVLNTTGKRSSNRKGTQSDLRKAYVTLAPGSHLPFFQAEETEVAEAVKETEKSKKDAKSTAVKAEKKEAVKPAKAKKESK